jgi:hypothetical protein
LSFIFMIAAMTWMLRISLSIWVIRVFICWSRSVLESSADELPTKEGTGSTCRNHIIGIVKEYIY